jgi:hypothetical protein
MRLWLFTALMLLFCFAACNTNKYMQTRHYPPTDNFLELLLNANSARLSPVFKYPGEYRLQVIYTRIDRDKHNQPHFQDFYYHVDSSHYFYPASTVKLPGAALALEKLNDLHVPGVDKYTPMFTDSLAGISPAVTSDSSAANKMPTIAHYIKKIFLTSDNDAFNRLYEFIGQRGFNENLWGKGYAQAQIRHRVGIPLNVVDNLYTNAIRFQQGQRVLYQQPAEYSRLFFAPRHDSIGKAHYNYLGKLQNGPMDFSSRNRLPLTDLHNIMRSIIFPEAVTNSTRFRLTESDYQFLYRCMSQLPSETTDPAYDTTQFQDAYVKFLLFGGEKTAHIPKHIRIFNKPGWAYGFLTDVAYIVDFANNVEFLLSATVYVNKDGVLGDDQYEFEETGKPFMKVLGELIYETELQRKKKYPADLSRYKITYDK